MMIIGIDPGISGSICFFQDGIIKDVIEMPTMVGISITSFIIPS